MGTRTIFRAWRPRALPQANKHEEARVTMGRPIPHPRGHTWRSVSITQPQDRSRREEPMERHTAVSLPPIEGSGSLFLSVSYKQMPAIDRALSYAFGINQ
jgi:hypothetical protein